MAAVAHTEAFELEPFPRRVHVLSRPTARPCAPAGSRSRAAVEGWHDPLSPEGVRWRSDPAGELGAGYDLTAGFRPGRHVVTAVVPDGLGGEASASIQITSSNTMGRWR